MIDGIGHGFPLQAGHKTSLKIERIVLLPQMLKESEFSLVFERPGKTRLIDEVDARNHSFQRVHARLSFDGLKRPP
jgi:hypothetical protein